MKWLGDFARWWVAYWRGFISACATLFVLHLLERGQLGANSIELLLHHLERVRIVDALDGGGDGYPEAGSSDSPGPGVRHTYLH